MRAMETAVETKTPWVNATGNDIRRDNLLIGTSREVSFSWQGQPAVFRLLGESANRVSRGCLRLRVAGQAFDLTFGAAPQPSVLGPSFAGIEIDLLPEEIALGVFDAMLEEPLLALRKVIGGPDIQVETWRREISDLPSRYRWELSRPGADPLFAGVLHADDQAMDALAGWMERARPNARRSGAEVPVPVSVVAGAMRLPVAELRALAVGDVLLPEIDLSMWQAGRYELWAAHRRIGYVQRQNQTFKLTSMNVSPESKAAVAKNASTPVLVEELPVQVVFDLGNVEVTVAQLRGLNEGFTFELPSSPAHAVNIRVNGREIGRGELVDLGSRLGVRIVSWNLE